nr:PREDICTED: luc7-like protein 3 [Megachile rotundata]
MDGVIRISEGIEKMAIAQAAAEAEKIMQLKEKKMDEKEKREEQERKERKKEEEAKEETERNAERRREVRVRAESEYPLSKNKIRKIIKRLLRPDRRSRGRGRGRGGETSSGWRRGGHSGWRRGGRGGHSGRHRGGRGGVNKNFFIINQNR